MHSTCMLSIIHGPWHFLFNAWCTEFRRGFCTLVLSFSNVYAHVEYSPLSLAILCTLTTLTLCKDLELWGMSGSALGNSSDRMHSVPRACI